MTTVSFIIITIIIPFHFSSSPMLTPLKASKLGWKGGSHPMCNAVPNSTELGAGAACPWGEMGCNLKRGKALRNTAPKGWKDKANMEEEMYNHL